MLDRRPRNVNVLTRPIKALETIETMVLTNDEAGRGRVARPSKWKPSRAIGAASAALMLVALAACDGDATGPGPVDSRVAITTREAGTAVLYIQNMDGTDRQRVHFDGIDDDIPGNESPIILPVTDESILAMGPVRWSPDGSRLAVVVTVAFDQSQVVVMNGDGSDKRAASPNQQIILGDVSWSPDGGRIAYTMSTLPHASGVDLFTTDLESNRVTRITTGAGLGVPGVETAWSAGGGQLFVSRVTGTGSAPLFEYTSAVNRIDLGTLQQTPVATGIAGEIAAISGGGDYVIIVRRAGETSSGWLEHLVRRDLGTGGESVLTGDDLLAWARLTAGERSILYTVAPPGTADVLNYFLLPATGGAAQRLGSIEQQTNSADVRSE